MAPVMLDGRLGEIAREATFFPVQYLREGGTGLCLFAARFWGVNDAIHMARNEMTLDLVDTSDRVYEMAEIYGADPWYGDAWMFAEDWREEGRQWDAVSVDTYTGDAERRSMSSLELWCSLARDMVAATHVRGTPYTVPAGWKDEWFPRNDHGTGWLVLTPA